MNQYRPLLFCMAVEADVAFINGGGIRGNTQHDAGHTITRRDVLNELPIGNGTVKLEVSGAIIKAALEHGYRQNDVLNPKFRILKF